MLVQEVHQSRRGGLCVTHNMRPVTKRADISPVIIRSLRSILRDKPCGPTGRKRNRGSHVELTRDRVENGRVVLQTLLRSVTLLVHSILPD
jgi:hypothetical protein